MRFFKVKCDETEKLNAVVVEPVGSDRVGVVVRLDQLENKTGEYLGTVWLRDNDGEPIEAAKLEMLLGNVKRTMVNTKTGESRTFILNLVHTYVPLRCLEEMIIPGLATITPDADSDIPLDYKRLMN